MIKIKSVYVNRAEGPIDLCGDATFEGPGALEKAQRKMREWAETAPEPGKGYDKCDFLITFDDGETYKGRYDLQSDGLDDGQTIGGHVLCFLRLLTGAYRPGWFSDEQWARMCESNKDDAPAAQEFLDTYEVA